MSFGERLRQVRKELGYSLSKLANVTYISRQALWRWERGDTQPNAEEIKILCEVLDVSSDWLLGLKEKAP